MSVRIMVCQCAAVFSSPARICIFECTCGPEQSTAIYIVGRNVPVLCRTKVTHAGTPTGLLFLGVARWWGRTRSATVSAAAIPTLELCSSYPADKDACCIFENDDDGVPFLFGVM
ncbi:hypothetical protein MRX96_055858 [Rhipicephalus microplus]